MVHTYTAIECKVLTESEAILIFDYLIYLDSMTVDNVIAQSLVGQALSDNHRNAASIKTVFCCIWHHKPIS